VVCTADESKWVDIAYVANRRLYMIRVIKGAIHVSDNDVRRMYELSTRGTHIFNPDKKRIQTTLDKRSAIVKSIWNSLIEHGCMKGRRIGMCVCLMSKPGCQKQAWHTDYDMAEVSRLEFKPAGVIVALEDNTFFEEYPNTRHVLHRGDALIFEGDVVHAGSAYDVHNVRLHAYLDVDTHKRSANKTYLFEGGLAEA